MRFKTGIALAALLATVLASPVAGDDKKAGAAGATLSIVATVEAIDTANREVTLKGPEGKSVTVAVPESVKRFSEIKVGDKLSVQYTEAVVVQVKKADASAKLGETSKTSMALAEGKKPGGAISRQTTVTVAVEAVDAAAPSITIRKADGKALSFRVQDAKRLEGVKPGDKIALTYVEAVALQVSAPTK